MVKTLQFLLTLAVLLVHKSTLNWQAAGNMSQSNLTVIKNYINANLSLTWTNANLQSYSTFLLTDFSTKLSKELNRQWDQAWNVFAPYYYTDTNNYDAVVYGYAYRNHWFWMNGIKFNDGYYTSVVLWKDYNCQKWWSFGQNDINSHYHSYDDSAGSFLNATILPIVRNVNSSTPGTTNIWLGAYKIGHALETDSKTKDYAFTVVAAQSIYAAVNGCFCAKDYVEFISFYEVITGFGRVFLIQTR